ncbi:MAG: hypothetical protein AAF950_16105 [Pseudomonadota bacterium]
MAAITHIFTIDLIAKRFGYHNDQIADIAYDQLKPEDGLIWVHDLDGKETIELSQDGIEALIEIIEDQYPQIAKQSQDNSPK